MQSRTVDASESGNGTQGKLSAQQEFADAEVEVDPRSLGLYKSVRVPVARELLVAPSTATRAIQVRW